MPQARDEVKEQAERAGKKDFRRIASGLASNLRRLSNDNHIKGLYEIPGEIVFGTEAYLGTTEQLQIDVITLVKIPRKPANRLLRMLPEKEFPELKGITDWSKLPYNRIHEAFLVRLETYF